MKYRAKPVVIDAWQVGTEPRPHWLDVALENEDLMRFKTHYGQYFSMEHPACEDVRLYAYPGDWIIRGTEFELYPCKNSVFKTKYEPVGEE